MSGLNISEMFFFADKKAKHGAPMAGYCMTLAQGNDEDDDGAAVDL